MTPLSIERGDTGRLFNPRRMEMTRAERESRGCYRRASECYRAAIIAADHGEEELARFWIDKAESYEDQAGLFLRFAELVTQDYPGEDFNPRLN